MACVANRKAYGRPFCAPQQVRFDPDTSIQTSVRQLFRTFQRTGSAVATVKEFRGQGLKFPRRIYHGANKGDVVWNDLQHSRVLWILGRVLPLPILGGLHHQYVRI
jgi:hypothetical protein